MSEITANEFLSEWKNQFVEVNKNEFISKNFFISFSSLYDATGGEASNIEEFMEILESENNDDVITLNRQVDNLLHKLNLGKTSNNQCQ